MKASCETKLRLAVQALEEKLAEEIAVRRVYQDIATTRLLRIEELENAQKKRIERRRADGGGAGRNGV